MRLNFFPIKIKEQFKKKFWAVISIYFYIFIGLEIGLITSLSIFLANAGIQKLPFILLLSGGLTLLLLPLYILHNYQKSDLQILKKIFLIAAIAVTLASITYFINKTVFSFVFYILADLLLFYTSIHFINLLNSAFDEKTAEDTYPIVYITSRAGAILGALLTFLSAKFSTLIPLFFIWMLINTLVVKYLIKFEKSYPENLFDIEESVKAAKEFLNNTFSGFKNIKDSKLLLSISLGTVVFAFLSIFLKYIYSYIFVLHFSSEEKLAILLSFVSIAANLLAIIIESASWKDLKSGGITNGFLSVTHGIFTLFSLIFTVFSKWIFSGILLRFSEDQLASSLLQKSNNFYFGAVPQKLRIKAQIYIKGFLKPVSIIIGSFFLTFLLIIPLNLTHLTYIAIAISILYIILCFYQNKVYKTTFLKNIEEGNININEIPAAYLRAEKEKIIDFAQKFINTSESDTQIKYGLDLFCIVVGNYTFSKLVEVYDTGSTGIRLHIIEKLKDYSSPEVEKFLSDLLPKATPIIRENLALVLSEGNFKNKDKYLELLASDPDPNVQFQALKYFASAKTEHREVILQIIKNQLNSKEKQKKINAINLIILLKERRLEKEIAMSLQDHDPQIQVEAFKALVEIHEPVMSNINRTLEFADLLTHGKNFVSKLFGIKLLRKIKCDQSFERLIKMLNETNDKLIEELHEALFEYGKGKHTYYHDLIKSHKTTFRIKYNLILLLRKMRLLKKDKNIKDIMEYLINNYFNLIMKEAALKERLVGLEKHILFDIYKDQKKLIKLSVFEIIEALINKRILVSSEALVLWNNEFVRESIYEFLQQFWNENMSQIIMTIFQVKTANEEIKIAKSMPACKKVFPEEILKKGMLSPDLWEKFACLHLAFKCNFDDLYEYIKAFDPKEQTLLKEVIEEFSMKVSRSSYEFYEKLREKGGKNFMLFDYEKIIFLRNVPLFEGFHYDELLELLSITNEEEYLKDENIINEGDVGDCMYIIVKGTVEIYKSHPETKEKKILNYLKETDFFGEMAILDRELRSASVRAQTDIRLLAVKQKGFEDLIYKNPQIALLLIRHLSFRLRKLSDSAARHNFKESAKQIPAQK